MNRTSDRQKLYYQILRVPSKDYEKHIMYNISLITKEYVEKPITIFVDPENLSMERLREHIAEMIHLHGFCIKTRTRLINYQNLVLSEVKSDAELLNIFSEYNYPKIRVEEVPENQINLRNNERLVSVNVKSHNSNTYALEKSFLIKVDSEMDFKDVVTSITQIATFKILTFSLLFNKEKVMQPFGQDITRKLPTLFFKSKEPQEKPEEDICQTITILIEISDQVPARRYLRGDRSIKIN